MTPLGLLVEMELIPARDREMVVRHLLSLGAAEKDVPSKKGNALVKAVYPGNEVEKGCLF